MKKIILFAAFLFTMNANVNAENEAVNNVEAYSINANINSLVRYLDLSKDQVESVSNIQKIFEDNLRYASYVNNPESRKKMVGSSIEFSVKNMNYILNRDQYKKYLSVLNATILNRGIDM